MKTNNNPHGRFATSNPLLAAKTIRQQEVDIAKAQSERNSAGGGDIAESSSKPPT
jgi:hypothetical protein